VGRAIDNPLTGLRRHKTSASSPPLKRLAPCQIQLRPHRTSTPYAPTVVDHWGRCGRRVRPAADLSGSWSFTPAGQGTTSIAVPWGWYKQGFTNMSEAVYSRTITVPDSWQPQSVWIEFGAVNHQATLSVGGHAVATQTTASDMSVTNKHFQQHPHGDCDRLARLGQRRIVAHRR
jgi:hypothetical protein